MFVKSGRLIVVTEVDMIQVILVIILVLKMRLYAEIQSIAVREAATTLLTHAIKLVQLQNYKQYTLDQETYVLILPIVQHKVKFVDMLKHISRKIKSVQAFA